jgi:transposase
MDFDPQKLTDDPNQLKQIIALLADERRRDQSRYEERIRYLEQYVRLLKNEIFGKKSEKHVLFDDKQRLLFTDEDAEPRVSEDPLPEPVVVPAHSRKKPGRKPLPADLPRVDVIHDIEESEKTCQCGCRLNRIGEDTCEKLDYVPAVFQVERHIRYKYACPACEGVDSDGPTVKIAPAPEQLIPKSIATPGLLAHILVSKFEDALPFYRQEKIFARLGVELSRATMCGWAIKIWELTAPLMELLCAEVRSGPVVNIDETTLQVLREPDRPNTSKSYMWVFRGGDPQHPALVFQYHPTRSGQVPLAFIDGYQGFVKADGYKGYEPLDLQSGIDLVGCWVHARRYFVKVVQARGNPKRSGSAEEALGFIGRLYAIEKQARERELSPQELYALRQDKAKPVLEEFKAWLDEKSLTTPPKGLLGKAIGYALKNWKYLVRYLDSGHLMPDNNLVENAIRPFVVGRKNWLFSGHPNGAEASAAIYSLIESAKANGLNPYYYLRYLFDRLLSAKTEQGLKDLLPQRLDPATINPT